jgi:hypothetical protein
MRAHGRDDRMIALSLGRCKPFLTVLSCDCRVSLATGADKLQVQSRPLCPRKRPTTFSGPHVAMGQQQTHAPQHYRRGANRMTASRRSLRNPIICLIRRLR